jgi:hypothetical protein
MNNNLKRWEGAAGTPTIIIIIIKKHASNRYHGQ